MYVRNVGLGLAVGLSLEVNEQGVDRFYAENDTEGLWGRMWRWTVIAPGQTLPAPIGTEYQAGETIHVVIKYRSVFQRQRFRERVEVVVDHALQ